MEPLKLGIVGGGPRGLYCLETLALQFEHQPRQVEVTMFEPCMFPGSGVVYHHDHPEYLIMNFAVQHIDIWSEESRRRYPQERLDLLSWLQRNHPDLASPHGCIPRKIVGEYLSDGFQQVVQSTPDNIKFRVVRDKVVDVVSSGESWRVLTSRNEAVDFDAIALTVGHEGWRPAGSPVEKQVFPVAENLSVNEIPPASSVSIRGFSLTWIDATLALTEGRGGSFKKGCDGYYVYQRSGREPETLVPFSRTGRPMLAKPDFELMHLPTGLNRIWNNYRSRLNSLSALSVDFSTDILPLVFEAASAASDSDTRGWFDQYIDGGDCYQYLEESYRMATGMDAPGAALTLAEAWRNLYPEIVRAIEHGRMITDSWSTYRNFSTEMERIAFGPPAVNVGKMLALLDDGILTLEKPGETDYTIDARIPSPKSLPKDSPVAMLLDRGTIRRLHNCEGIEVTVDGSAISLNGYCHENLAIFGRVTEGCVIGNDTLSRSLNQHIDRWAISIASRSASKNQTTINYEYYCA